MTKVILLKGNLLAYATEILYCPKCNEFQLHNVWKIPEKKELVFRCEFCEHDQMMPDD